MAGFPTAGDQYGRYRVVAEIGHGGMGVVYEALDSVLNRLVALKIVLPSLPDREEYHQRFAHEAEALAKIKSRNIVGIYDYGEHEDTVFFATEYFPDGDLQSWLQSHGPMDRRASLALVAQVCEALADAHAAGVVHRDVKPGNVLLWNRPEGLVPYLCDFGIAVESRPGSRSGLTRTGALIGSPAYMAPERHFGHPADERGDVYSAGCLLWATLTGDAPYSGTDFQMMNSHINGSVPGLRTGHPVDDRIDQVLAVALDKDPARRIPTAAEFRSRLLEIVRDIDSAALPLPPLPEDGTPRPVARADDTRIRPAAGVAAASTPPPAVPPAAPGPAETPAAPADRPRRRRGLLVAAAVAAAVVVAVGATTLAVDLTGSGDGEAADPPASAAPTSSAPTSAPPLTPPRPPKVKAGAGYRSVLFTVADKELPAGAKVELKHEGTWVPLGKPVVRVPTKQGGDEGCLQIRTVLAQDGETATSAPVSTCGRAQPRTAVLVRTAGACTAEVDGFTYPCQWYGVRLSGYASGSAPQARMHAVGEPDNCPTEESCQQVPVGEDGRASTPRFFRILADSGLWVLDVDGVTSRAELTLTP